MAIADTGTFDAAAARLHVTPSAISQRIRALEASIGRVVVQRTTPCRPTEAGEILLRLARQSQLLQAETAAAFGEVGLVELSLAVNADSLASWFRDVLSEVATWDGVALKLQVEDQAWSSELLRSGSVLGAVTSDPSGVQGCSVEPLGALRYLPAAQPDFAERWRKGRSFDWATMPAVVFNEKDQLQSDWLGARGVSESPVTHRVPTSADFHAAVVRGLGWGAIPEPDFEAEAPGNLVRLTARGHIDVPLYWQRWRIDSPLLDRATAAVRAAARSHLRRPVG